MVRVLREPGGDVRKGSPRDRGESPAGAPFREHAGPLPAARAAREAPSPRRRSSWEAAGASACPVKEEARPLPSLPPVREEEDADRTRQPHLLGMPLMRGKTCTGALVLVRFGGPVFTRKDERLAGFLVMQIVIMLQHKALEHQVEILDVLRRQAYLQDSFVSMITHELRHPMGFIKGYVTTLLRDEVEWDSKTQIEFLQIIDHETDQLLIINIPRSDVRCHHDNGIPEIHYGTYGIC